MKTKRIDQQIIASEDELHERTKVVRRLLRPFSNQMPVLRTPVGADNVVIHAGRHLPGTSPEEALFGTSLEGVRGNYYERWRLLGRGDEFYLSRSYFHLKLVRNPAIAPVELIALHCELRPYGLGPYEKGLHIHASTAGDPLKHAHIGLELAQELSYLSSLADLDGVLSAYFEMIRSELIGRLGREVVAMR